MYPTVLDASETTMKHINKISLIIKHPSGRGRELTKKPLYTAIINSNKSYDKK